MRYFLSALFILTGASHFLKTQFYLKIMPAYLPYPLELVYVSGTAAIVLGLLLLLPKTASIACWGIILFLIAVFPANVYMALHPEIFPEIPAWAGWIRLPFQGVFIYWAYRLKNYPRQPCSSRENMA